MSSNTQLQKVKKFKFAKQGEFVSKNLLFITLCSCFGNLCSVFLFYELWNMKLIDNSTEVLSLGSLIIPAVGTGVGFYISALFSNFYKKDEILTSSFLTIIIFLFVNFFLFIINNFLSRIFEVFYDLPFFLNYWIIWSIGNTLWGCIALHASLIEGVHYCEICQKFYTSMRVFSSTSVSPYKILSLLQNKKEFPNVSDLEADKSFPVYNKKNSEVDITASYCPQCYDAIVNADISYEAGFISKERKSILFYSDFWNGNLFKKVFHIENNIIQTPESKIVHHAHKFKKMTEMECYFSKKALIKHISLFMFMLIMFSVMFIISFYANNIFLFLVSILFIVFIVHAIYPVILNFFNNNSQFIVNNLGVEFCQLKTGVIYWQDIEKILLINTLMNNCKFTSISLRLIQPEKYFNQSMLKKVMKNREKGGYDIGINFSLLTPPENEVWEYIAQLCEEKNYIRNNANPNEYIKSESS